MKDIPGRCWLVMERKTEKEWVEFVAINYKYNNQLKVLFFVKSKGAGPTRPGKLYIAKFNDQQGNVLKHEVPIPVIPNWYFCKSNNVDIHNHIQQHLLVLEECWVTPDGYFCQKTTFLSITVTDMWYLKENQAIMVERGQRTVTKKDFHFIP